MEKNDLAMIKAEHDRLVTDIEKLKQRLREEVTRTQAGVRLDLNLEKGRMREESAGQELKIKEVDTKIEQEIAALRTAIQSSKVTSPNVYHRLAVYLRVKSGYDTAIPRWFRYVYEFCMSLGCSDV
jgi:chromosome segregation ATPase